MARWVLSFSYLVKDWTKISLLRSTCRERETHVGTGFLSYGRVMSCCSYLVKSEIRDYSIMAFKDSDSLLYCSVHWNTKTIDYLNKESNGLLRKGCSRKPCFLGFEVRNKPVRRSLSVCDHILLERRNSWNSKLWLIRKKARFWPDNQKGLAHVTKGWFWLYLSGGLFHSGHRHRGIMSGFQEYQIRWHLSKCHTIKLPTKVDWVMMQSPALQNFRCVKYVLWLHRQW